MKTQLLVITLLAGIVSADAGDKSVLGAMAGTYDTFPGGHIPRLIIETNGDFAITSHIARCHIVSPVKTDKEANTVSFDSQCTAGDMKGMRTHETWARFYEDDNAYLVTVSTVKGRIAISLWKMQNKNE
jgi:hypothetical protein